MGDYFAPLVGGREESTSSYASCGGGIPWGQNCYTATVSYWLNVFHVMLPRSCFLKTSAFLPVIASHSPFPMSSHLVDLRLLSKNLSSVMACVPMLILLPLLRSNVSRESDGTGLSLTWRGGGRWCHVTSRHPETTVCCLLTTVTAVCINLATANRKSVKPQLM